MNDRADIVPGPPARARRTDPMAGQALPDTRPIQRLRRVRNPALSGIPCGRFRMGVSVWTFPSAASVVCMASDPVIRSGPAVPPRVVAAERAAADAGFKKSCVPEVGRLLRLAAASKPHGTIAESGTGSGVGTAWLHSGLGDGARLVTVERDAELSRRAAGVFADDKRVRVLTGDWRLLEQHAPFDVFFCDGGGKRDDPHRVVELLAPGGLLVLDDFTPSSHWPPRFEGEVDELRLLYLTHPDLEATEALTTPTSSAVLAARRL